LRQDEHTTYCGQKYEIFVIFVTKKGKTGGQLGLSAGS
jgi:hypothetical protein